MLKNQKIPETIATNQQHFFYTNTNSKSYNVMKFDMPYLMLFSRQMKRPHHNSLTN